MIEQIRALLKSPKKGKAPTAAQLAEAMEKGKAERETALARRAELRKSMGTLLLDGSPEEIHAREGEIADADLTLKRWDAILEALEARRVAQEAAEAEEHIDAMVARAAKLVQAGHTCLREYEMHAIGAAAQLEKLTQLREEWYPLEREIDKAGRTTDLVAALDGDGGAIQGPGFVAGLGNLQSRGNVELPSTARYEPHWGSHYGQTPVTPPAPPPPPDLIEKHFPGAIVWTTWDDGKMRSKEYRMTREEMQAAAEAKEAAGTAAPR